VAHTQADPAASVVRDHPDWVIAEADDYFGAVGLCIGHEPCRDWITGELSRLAGEEGITYLLQDGEDIVKHCTAAGHTHGPGGSHFAASSRGLDVMLDTLHRRHPDLVLENCEDGGVMQTYAMARRYHTTITVDNIGTYHTRQGVYGASYPFPPRYSVRYMQDAPDPYSLRSVLFGGPLILMQRAGEWSPEQIERVRASITRVQVVALVHRLVASDPSPRSDLPSRRTGVGRDRGGGSRWVAGARAGVPGLRRRPTRWCCGCAGSWPTSSTRWSTTTRLAAAARRPPGAGWPTMGCASAVPPSRAR
jgi:hypothetical protein